MSKDRVAFVTGANRGLGLETVRLLAEKGITVIMGSRDHKKGENAAKALKEKGYSIIVFPFDVNSFSDHKAVFNFINEKFGKLDILVNNAGLAIDKFEWDVNTTSKTSLDTLRRTFETNFFSLIALTQTLLPLIKKSSAGRIVNLSSILGSLTHHSDPNSPIYRVKSFAYNASKTALNAFTVHLADELKNTSIKVNSAHPGWVKTDMGGEEAPLEVTEGAKTTLKLALLPENGPTGKFYHFDDIIPW